MTKITNSNDLNYYYNNTVKNESKLDKKNKTRLIIRKDKDTGKEYLATKKLTLTERIGALFGGRASFSRIVEFCNHKNFHSEGLAELVKNYNKSHTDKQINYSYLIPGTSKNEKPLILALKPEEGQQTNHKLEDEQVINAYINEAYENKNDDGLVAILEKLPQQKKQQLLEEACASGKIRMIDLLHKSGMTDFNAKTSIYTPLMTAVEAGHEDVVQKLLTLGADPKISIPYLGDALQIAAKKGHSSIAATLAYSLKDSFTPERLIKLLEEPDVNELLKVNLIAVGASKVNEDGKDALMLAIDQGKLDVAVLLRSDTNLERQDKDGNNALLLACKQPQSDVRNKLISIFLLRAPQALLQKNRFGQDAIMYASQYAPDLQAKFESFAQGTKRPEAQQILARLAEEAKQAENAAKKVEAAKKAAREAETSKNLDIIKTETKKYDLTKIGLLNELKDDTPLLAAYRAIDKAALKDLDRTRRGLLLMELCRTPAGTTNDDRNILINKNLDSAARVPLIWLKAQLDKLPITGLSTKDKVAKLHYETKGKELMTAYAPVIDKEVYTNLVRDYPAFKP